MAWFIMHASHPPNASAVSTFQPDTPPDPPAIPAWVPATLYEWAAVSLNALSDVDPEDEPGVNPNYPGVAPWAPCPANLGQAGVIVAWNGGAFASDLGSMGSLLYFGGGHNAYFGNEISRYDVATRLWLRATDPFAGSVGTLESPGSHPLGEFSDGTPLPAHTYSGLEYAPGMGLFVSPMSNGLCEANTQSYRYSHVYTFTGGGSLPADSWVRTPDSSNTSGSTSAVAYDTTRGIIWRATEAQPLDSYDPSVGPVSGEYGAWTRHGSNWGVAKDSAACYYAADDLMIHNNFNVASNLRAIQCANPAAGHTVLTESGPAPHSPGSSFNWIPDLGKFAVHNGANGDLYLLTPPAQGLGLTGTWTWEQIACTGTPPVTAGAPVYQRMRYVPAIKCLIVCNDVNQSVFALRVAA